MDFKKILSKIIIAYIVIAIVFYSIAKDDITYGSKSKAMLVVDTACESIQKGDEIRQKYVPSFDRLDSITILPATYARENTDIIDFVVENANGETLYGTKLDTSVMGDLQPYTIVFDEPIYNAKGQELVFVFSSEKGTESNGIGFAYGNSIATNRGLIDAKLTEDDYLSINGETINRMLCFDANGTEFYYWGTYYWYFFAAVLAILAIIYIWLIVIEKKGKKVWLLSALSTLSNYGFLLKQMVERDFKTRYKRSVLGSLWSLLNPLLAMAVQYFVFSTLFNASINNYPIYLLIGIIMYNFFSESVGMNVTAITGNVTLITKVYIPKYIFPLARVLSSLVNLVMSLIPLLIFLALTRTRIAASWLLIPFALICLVVFCLGFGMLLCTMMVFFRDVAFLWGILSMFWMYLTPIFYSESIIPEQYLFVYRLNPLLHYISFMRTCLIDGHSPNPETYFACIFSSLLMLVVGCFVFKKKQDYFVLNL